MYRKLGEAYQCSPSVFAAGMTIPQFYALWGKDPEAEVQEAFKLAGLPEGADSVLPVDWRPPGWMPAEK